MRPPKARRLRLETLLGGEPGPNTAALGNPWSRLGSDSLKQSMHRESHFTRSRALALLRVFITLSCTFDPLVADRRLSATPSRGRHRNRITTRPELTSVTH